MQWEALFGRPGELIASRRGSRQGYSVRWADDQEECVVNFNPLGIGSMATYRRERKRSLLERLLEWTKGKW